MKNQLATQVDAKALYKAFMAKDTRFDGRFFVGISSTGIYCRPVCRAKQPKEENCTFYASAAEAEKEGYRPCLLCRPELAPGTAKTDAVASLAYKTAKMLEENCTDGFTIEEIAIHLGCTDRHLRRVFRETYGVLPKQYLQTCRLLLAKNLLTETNLSVLEVAMAAGFGSLRRFNDLFKNQYRLAPSAFRKKTERNIMANHEITISLGYRPPYPWADMLLFLDKHAIEGIDCIQDNVYWRGMRMVSAKGKKIEGWLCVGHNPKKHVLTVTLSETLLPVLPQIVAKVKNVFDLESDPHLIYDTLKSMNTIYPGSCQCGTRIPGSFNAFEMAVQAVLASSISLQEANELCARIASVFGTPIGTGKKELQYVFPQPEDIKGQAVKKQLNGMGIAEEQANAILKLAKTYAQKDMHLATYAQPELAIEKLKEISDLQEDTVQYIIMRSMDDTDAFYLPKDVKKRLGEDIEVQFTKKEEKWQPWRSYVAVNLWQAAQKNL